jgi:hypothetical protein
MPQWHESRAFRKKKGTSTYQKEISEIIETDEKGKLACLAVNRDEFAMASFSIELTTESQWISFTLSEWRIGPMLKLIWLCKNCTSGTDLLSKVEMRQNLSRVKMKKDMDHLSYLKL